MQNIFVVNQNKLNTLKEKIKKNNFDSFHVLVDFDRTLTLAFQKGEKIPSIIAILRKDEKYLGKKYQKEAEKLFLKYHPIEVDINIKREEKKREMEKWWREHFKLLIESGLTRKNLRDVVFSGKIKLRDGVLEFFDFLHQKNVPLVIMSGNGLGGEVIKMYLQKVKRLYPNIYIISNSFYWDDEGRISGVKEPIVHMLNKDETLIKKFSFFNKIEKRKDVMLFGDNIEDVDMIKGFEYNFLIKFGFLNENVEKNIEHYKKFYDALILNDSSFSFINNLFKI
jgi:cytosolic 5'-nucleotidase 3